MDVHSGTLCQRTGNPVIGLKCSRDGSFVAGADLDRTIRVWHKGRLVLQQALTSKISRMRSLDRIRCFELSPGAYSIFVASGEAVREIELGTGRELWREGRPPMFGFLVTCPKTLALSCAGELALVYDDGVMEALPIGFPGRKPVRWRDNDAPFSMSYLSDAKTLVGTDGMTICFWDTRNGVKKARWVLQKKICAVASSHRGSVLAIRTLHRVIIYDTFNHQAQGSAPVLRGLPSLAVSADGEYVPAGDQLGVSVFDRQGTLVDRYPQIGPATLAVSFVPGHNTIAVGSTDGSIVLWQFQAKQQLMPAFML